MSDSTSNSTSPSGNSPPGKPSASQFARTVAIKGAFLFAVWVLLSGKLDAFHLGTGLVGVAFLLWLDSRLEPLGRSGKWVQIHPLRWMFYYFWLLWQMVLSAVYVARVVISPGRHLNPQLVRFRCVQPNVIASVALANSITLTPGTLTVDLEDDCYLIHALTERTAWDVLDGSMQARVARIFVDGPPPPVERLPVPAVGERRP